MTDNRFDCARPGGYDAPKDPFFRCSDMWCLVPLLLWVLVVLESEAPGRAQTASFATQPAATAIAADALLPDLVVDRMSIELATGGACNFTLPSLGTRVFFSNTGLANAGPFAVQVNDSVDSVQRVAGLHAGHSASLWFSGHSGTATTAFVDVFDEVQERDEANNRQSGYVPVPTLPPTCTPTLAVTATPPTPTPTPIPSAGGRAFTLGWSAFADRPQMSWRSGTRQDAYVIFRFSDGQLRVLPPAAVLAQPTTDFSDQRPDVLTCYFLIPLGGTPLSPIANSDCECFSPLRSVEGSPGSFALRLDETNVAKLTWTSRPPPTGVIEGYTLFALGPRVESIALPPSASSYEHDTAGAITVYVLAVRVAGRIQGNTDALIAVPGLARFP